MPGSRASVFGEAEDFQAALSVEGIAGLLVTGRGQFRARLTQVALERLRLSAVEETVSRIAFVAVPAGAVLVAFAINRAASPIWGGAEIRAGEMITFDPGQRVHARTVGRCHWGTLQAPQEQLCSYGRALTGARFVLPSAARCRPARTAARQLLHLHHAAIRMAEARLGALTDLQAAHGLEQQLLHALIECLSEGVEEETITDRRHRNILARFEDLLVAEPLLTMREICTALDVSERLLRACCKQQLGMGPSNYRRLRAMQQVYRALRSGNPDATSVSEVAKRNGFLGLGRLASNYRALYGELPSATLRRGLGQELTLLTSHGRRSRA